VDPQWENEITQKKFVEDHQFEMEGLNDTQKKSVTKAFTCKDYQMIIGVPGSGKMEVIIRLMDIVKKNKKKLLVINFNNKTSDNLILRVLEH